jgi:hypothetical protein
MNLRTAATSCLLALSAFTCIAADPEPAMSAADLAGRLSAKQQDGNAVIRLRMEIAGDAKSVLQLQIKSRASRAGTDLVYQVLFPKERKGEAILLRKSGSKLSGTQFTPPDKLRTLAAAQMDESLFGSALSYEDVIENFFAWDQQSIVGNETVDRVNCTILESKPGKGDRSSYGSVRAWVDTRRFVPLRIEKYSGGKMVRRIDTTKVVNDDKGRPIPANLSVRGPRGVTELDGSKIKHGVPLTDADFTPQKLGDIGPAGNGE